MTQLPLACTLTSPELRAQRTKVLEFLRRYCREQHAAPNGYRFRFDAQPDVLAEIAALIDVERQCCAFLRFQLTVEPADGPVWLELTGPAGTREFLDTELGPAGEAFASGA